MKKLYKSRTNVKIDGVCAGVANYFGIDVTLVRIIWAVVALSGGTGLIAYFICSLVMPREPEGYGYTAPYQSQ
jgi:phage shock protein PspC (stress-responsive transcriptional regulator)